MSKQLVMENYVDECLDEVEIRDLFITEGIMDTPIMGIIQKLKNRIENQDIEIYNIKITMRDNWKKVTGSHAKIENLKLDLFKIPSKYTIARKHRYEMIKDAEKIMKKGEEINLKLLDDIKKVEKQKTHIKTLIKQIKSNPDMLGNVPYLYQIIGATMIVVAVAYASYKLYKRFMSKAAKACQDKKGKVKTICMNQYQMKALEASKKPLTDGMKGCSKAKEVQACKAKFNKKINTIDKKITKKQNQIKKLMSK